MSVSSGEVCCRFYEDFGAMMRYLAELSLDLRTKPLAQRNQYLWEQLKRFNYHLYSRMLQRGPWAGMDVPPDKYAPFGLVCCNMISRNALQTSIKLYAGSLNPQSRTSVPTS